MMPKRLFSTAIVILCISSASATAASETNDAIGRKIDNFTLKDFRGQPHSLAGLSGKKAIVVAFLGTECPLAKLYAPRLQTLAQQYGKQGVAFLGINANRQDSITEVATHARRHGITFPILKDLANEVADRFGAERTPEVFILDENRVIRYRGRIDDQYGFDFGVGYQKPTLSRADLALALDELLAGQEVSIAVTEAKGCIIGRIREADENSEVTYSNQVARIFQNRCVECHREGQIAPFALTNYDEAAGWGEMIDEVVREQRMPPWHASPKFGKFANDLRLSEEEKQTIFTWVENGCPEGDAANLPEPREFAEGWTLPREPDMIIYMQDEEYEVAAEGVVDYQYMTIDPGFTEDKWIQVSECMPGNRRVVHHIIVYIEPPGVGELDFSAFTFLAGFAPGTRPFTCPDNMAMKIPAGSKLVFELHYTPCGTVERDRSSIGLIFADPDKITHQVATTAASNDDFVIPPNASEHRVDSSVTFTREGEILSLFPHMHLRGKAFRYILRQPDGSEEVLLDVPRYDFNWQYYYVLDRARPVTKGTQLLCEAAFDNSEDNLANPDPTETVRYGLQTWEEMMIGWYTFALPRDGVVGLFTEEEEKAAAEAAAAVREGGTTGEEAGAE